jgi:hypothetical protein
VARIIEKIKMHTQFCLQNRMRAHHWEDLRPRWEHSTIMDPKEIGLGFGLDSSGSRQGPVLG